MARLGAVLGLVAALAMGAAPSPLRSQVVQGALVDPADHSPLAGVTVLVSRVRGGVNHRAVTDSAGRFKLRPYPRGRYQLSAELPWGRVDLGLPLGVMAEDTFTVLGRVPRNGTAPAELEILSGTRSPRLEEVGFYRRSTSGTGAHFGPAVIHSRQWFATGGFLSHWRIRATMGLRTPFDGFAFRAFRDFRPGDAFGVHAPGGGCQTLFVDGVRRGMAYPELLDRFAPREIEGIEIYPTYGRVPREFATGDPSCGATLIWLRY